MTETSPQFMQAVDTVKDHPLFVGAVRKFYTAKFNGSEGEDQPAKVRWTAAELLHTQFPETKWAVPGILPEGLSILAGRPKLGKSWMALQIAHAVGMGGCVLGKRVERGNVLYLALEDGPKRLQERLMLQQVPDEAWITFITDWKPLSDGGLPDLEGELTTKDYRLIVIDTFSRATGGRDDQQDMQDMTRIMGALQKLALLNGEAILLVDHHKKPGAFNSDPIDDILGSTGKAAVADCALGLYRERGKPGATLRITGRDMPDSDMVLSWDGQLCCWQYEGMADQVREDSERGRVLMAVKALQENGELPTTKNISTYTGVAQPNVSTCLQTLVTDGKVKRGDKVGVQQPYYLVDTSYPSDEERE